MESSLQSIWKKNQKIQSKQTLLKKQQVNTS